MAKFHKLTVTDVRTETSDTVSVAFSIPEEMKEAYQFHQGQYLTLRRDIQNEDVRRSYSICSAVGNGELRVAIKKVDGGLFSTFANEELKEGDELDVMTPMGKFYVPLNPANKKHYVLFAAGSGITPMMSIIKTTLIKEPQSEVTLIYGNRHFSSIIFREELEDLKDRYLGKFRVFHLLSRESTEIELLSGRVNGEKCGLFFKSLLDINNCDEFFICGPEPMINEVSAKLKELGAPDEKVHFELFTSPKGDLWKETPKEEVHEDHKGKKAHVKVTIDGAKMEFDMDYDGIAVLDAALDTGADLPFSCKGGVCRTCMAKLEKGTVRMDMNFALEPGEVEEGYILTCQSHPTSEELEVNYDVAG